MRTTNHPPLPPEIMVTLSSESNQNSHLHKESGIVNVVFVINNDIYVCLGNTGERKRLKVYLLDIRFLEHGSISKHFRNNYEPSPPVISFSAFTPQWTSNKGLRLLMVDFSWPTKKAFADR